MLTLQEMAHKSLVGEDSDELQWKTLSLTHVVYPRGLFTILSALVLASGAAARTFTVCLLHAVSRCGIHG